MALVTFTLSADGVGAFNDALMCIHKFSDDVAVEIRKDELVLTALNLTKSAYARYAFSANRFFSRFSFEGNAQYREKFYCVMYIKALLTVFRNRNGGDPVRDRDNAAIEKCDVTIEDGLGKKSRFIAKVFGRNGITATHRLAFEARLPVHAKFNKSEAVHHWTIKPRTLRTMMDHFGPGIDLLDINIDGDNVVNFTCFTEKQANINNEAFLKKPLYTSIAVEMDEFDDISVADKLHIIISLRDFRAIVQHANYTSSELVAAYSRPGRPMKISYNGDGTVCEFILMTVDEKSTSAQKGQPKAGAKKARATLDAASSSAQPATAASAPAVQPSPVHIAQQQEVRPSRMPPPPQRSNPRLSQFDIRAPLQQPPSTLKSESLFLPQPDDDEQWEPVNVEEDDEEAEHARLEWDASNQPDSTMRISNHCENSYGAPRSDGDVDVMPSTLEPTQQLADVRKFGLFSG
ncbi:Rad9-domain-containing protein [Coniella lustricola]|uniref:DNA repair protein rad9 n=1 Tax=Coniella lustricola TaxID=2025994 RepID=A0A2T3A6E6_9PEZI|nr:Rad9-domain-containing protein [Coniella lustricola]